MIHSPKNILTTPLEAAEAIMDGDAVFNTKTGFLAMPDTVHGEEGDDAEGKNLEYYNCGVTDHNFDFLLGLMYCRIDPDKADEYRKEEGSLEMWARGNIPAPGALLAEYHMTDTPIYEFNDIMEFFKELFEDEADGWIRDEQQE